jgi:hypothetical protein
MSQNNTLYMETTQISPDRTCGEIVSLLVRCGATQINMQYEAQRIKGLRWCLRINGHDQLFDMPVRVDPVRAILRRRGRPGDHQKAERVAWRQLLRWTEAQSALIECGMVQPAEPFMSYAFDPIKDQTLFQAMMETRYKLLPAAESTNQQIEGAV